MPLFRASKDHRFLLFPEYELWYDLHAGHFASRQWSIFYPTGKMSNRLCIICPVSSYVFTYTRIGISANCFSLNLIQLYNGYITFLPIYIQTDKFALTQCDSSDRHLFPTPAWMNRRETSVTFTANAYQLAY